jgi:nucleoside-diphosphate kinase
MERTLAIIKPDAVAAGHTGPIIERIEAAGFQIRAMRMVRLTRPQAEGFYAVHRERPFFGQLAQFMSSGPAIVLALDGPDAISRKEFGTSIERNATHGSDAPETAAFEIGFFFPAMELA